MIIFNTSHLDDKNLARYIKVMDKTVNTWGQWGELRQVLEFFSHDINGKEEINGKYYLSMNEDKMISVPKLVFDSITIE
jgi:hypothetical protein